MESFGSVMVQKNNDWEFVTGGSSGQVTDVYKIDWGFSSLRNQKNATEYTDLISGRILDDEIEELHIVTQYEREYTANIIEYQAGKRFWFLATEGESLMPTTAYAFSKEGEVIEQLRLPGGRF